MSWFDLQLAKLPLKLVYGYVILGAIFNVGIVNVHALYSMPY